MVNGENGKKGWLPWTFDVIQVIAVVFFAGMFYKTVESNHQEFLCEKVNNEKCHTEIKSDIKDMINIVNASVQNTSIIMSNLKTQVAVLSQEIDDMRKENKMKNF